MTEAQIKDTLIALLGGIKGADAATIRSSMAALDEVLTAQRHELHPQLAHFLERRSYAKALQYLGGAEDIPAGNCGGKPRSSS